MKKIICTFSPQEGRIFCSLMQEEKSSLGLLTPVIHEKADITNSAMIYSARKIINDNSPFEFSANGKRYAMSVVEIEG